MRKRKVWIEPLFGEAKQWHGMRQFRLRGLQKVNMEGLFIAAGQNLKRLLSAKGWGRRPGRMEQPVSLRSETANLHHAGLTRDFPTVLRTSIGDSA